MAIGRNTHNWYIIVVLGKVVAILWVMVANMIVVLFIEMYTLQYTMMCDDNSANLLVFGYSSYFRTVLCSI